MVNAIRSITINEGLDPRASLLIAGGGAGGMTIGRIAEALECERVLVPRTAGALSASGGLFSDIVSEFSVSQRTDTGSFDYAGINRTLAGLDAQMEAFFNRLNTPPEQRSREFFVEARYPYQVWELEVPLAVSQFSNAADVQSLVDGFHRAHERVFAVNEPGQQVECIYWKARATAKLAKPLRGVTVREALTPHPLVTRDAWFDGLAPQPTPRYHGPDLPIGAKLTGPCVIQEPTTTIVLFPHWHATVTETGDYMMERGFNAA
jgi:N-methylhydantoinase A